MSQFLVFFTGMAGRSGFIGSTGASLRNRYSIFGHSGYFIDSAGKPSDDYLRQHWVPLLTTEDPAPAFDFREPPTSVDVFLERLATHAGLIKLAVYISPFIVLSIIYFNLYREAEHQRKIAVSRQHAAEAVSRFETNLDDAIAFSARALLTEPTQEARNVAYHAATNNPEIRKFLYRLDANTRHAVAVDARGRHFIVARDDTFDLFEFRGNDPEIVATVRPLVGAIKRLTYSPTGSYVAVGGADGRVSRVSTSTWQIVGSAATISQKPIDEVFFAGTDNHIFALSDAHWIGLSASHDDLKETGRGGLLEEDARGRFRHVASAVTADGRTLVTGYGIKVTVWDVDGELRQRYSFNTRHQVTVGIREVAIAPQGEKIAVDLLAGSDGIPANFVQVYVTAPTGIGIKLIDAQTTKYLWDGTSRLSFNHKGDLLVIGHFNGRFEELDFSGARPTRQSLKKVNGVAEGIVHQPRFSKDDRSLLLGVGRRVVVWDRYPQSPLVRLLHTYKDAPTSLAFAEEGRKVVLVTSNGSIQWWDVKTGEMKEPTPPRTNTEASLKSSFVTRDATRVILVKQDDFDLIDRKTGVAVRNVPLQGWTPLAMNSDGSLVAVFRSGVVRLLRAPDFKQTWSAQVYDQPKLLTPPVRGPRVSFSKDGTKVFIQVFGHSAVTEFGVASGNRIRDIQTGAQRAWTWDSEQTESVESADGNWLAVPTNNYSLRIVNTKTNAAIQIEAPGSIGEVAFDPNNATLAIAYETSELDREDTLDGRRRPATYGIRFWNLTEREWAAVPLIVLSEPASNITFSPDGKLIAITTTTDKDDNVPSRLMLFDLDPARWASIALGRVGYKQ